MKHHLSAFRRSPWLSIAIVAILGLMLLPVGLMAAVTAPATPAASLGLNPLMLGSLGCVGAIMLRTPAGDEGESGGGGAKAEDKLDLATAIAQVEDRTLPMGQRLSIAAKVMKGIDPTQQLSSIQKQFTDAQAAITLKDAEIAKLKADLTTAQQSLAARDTDVTQLEAANAQLEKDKLSLTAKEQDIEKRSASKSKEHLASLGFPAAKLPAADNKEHAEVPATRAALEEQMATLKTANERSELLKKFRAQHAAN
jgi:hypothetical protein